MIKLNLCMVSCVLLALSVSCAEVTQELDTGPVITGCLVDVAQRGYHCEPHDGISFFVSFDQVDTRLKCIHPDDLEDVLKGCKKGKALSPTYCQISNSSANCQSSDGKISLIEIKSMENYFCVNDAGWKRIFDRCL